MKEFLKIVAKEIVTNAIDSNYPYNITATVENYDLFLTEEEESFLIQEVCKLFHWSNKSLSVTPKYW